MRDDAVIHIEDVVKVFPVGDGGFTALNHVDLTITAGEFTGFVGPSGSGKTTLLNIIGALDAPSSGNARILGKDTKRLKHKQAAALRNENIGFIFQTFNLLPVYTVFENVELPLILLKMKASERKKEVSRALEWVGLTDKIDMRPSRLSGGECQRVAVARAMVKNPKIILADEPTANLDAANSHNILDMMVTMNEELNATFLFATHDEKVIGRLRRVINLEDGRIVGESSHADC